MYDLATTAVGVSTVRALVDRMAESRPEAVYLVSPETGLNWTYPELRRQSNGLGQKLCELGCGAGDKIAFMMDDGLFTAGLFLGAMYGGFVPVPLNVRAGRSQLLYIYVGSLRRESGFRVGRVSPGDRGAHGRGPQGPDRDPGRCRSRPVLGTRRGPRRALCRRSPQIKMHSDIQLREHRSAQGVALLPSQGTRKGAGTRRSPTSYRPRAAACACCHCTASTQRPPRSSPLC